MLYFLISTSRGQPNSPLFAQTGEVTDAHSLEAGTPIVDECTQDWTLLAAEARDGSLVFEAERALDTGDAQDWVFTDDSGDGERETHCVVLFFLICPVQSPNSLGCEYLSPMLETRYITRM